MSFTSCKKTGMKGGFVSLCFVFVFVFHCNKGVVHCDFCSPPQWCCGVIVLCCCGVVVLCFCVRACSFSQPLFCVCQWFPRNKGGWRSLVFWFASSVDLWWVVVRKLVCGLCVLVCWCVCVWACASSPLCRGFAREAGIDGCLTCASPFLVYAAGRLVVEDCGVPMP